MSEGERGEPGPASLVTVSYETADGREAGDYTVTTAGETAKTVSVATAEDTRNEDQEEFTVTLSEQTNATLGSLDRRRRRAGSRER